MTQHHRLPTHRALQHQWAQRLRDAEERILRSINEAEIEASTDRDVARLMIVEAEVGSVFDFLARRLDHYRKEHC